MRRLLFCTVGLLAVGLVIAPAALAQASSASVSRAPSLARTYARLSAGPTYAFSGHVLDFAGTPVAGAEVDWGWWSSLVDYHFGGSNLSAANQNGTGADGAFAFTAATGGHQLNGVPSDDLRVFYYPTQPGLEWMQAEQLDFASSNDATPYSYQMQPAEVNISLANGLGSPVEVKAGNSNVGLASADVALTSGNGVASVLPMSNFDDLVAYYYSGTPGFLTCPGMVEWLGTAMNVSAGQIAATVINLDWANAQYCELAGPRCQHSGAPGSTVKMVLWGWPGSEKASFIGYNAVGTPHKYSATLTSQGVNQVYAVSLRIDPKASVGPYQLDAFRSDDLDSFVQMWDYYQVCRFKASASSIHPGRAVRLSGKVPGTGRVTLYAKARKSGQPSSLAATGWTRLGTYGTKSGSFVTGYLHPKHTTYYVVRYNGRAFRAFTSVARVVVR
jgi:hypothetical protein